MQEIANKFAHLGFFCIFALEMDNGLLRFKTGLGADNQTMKKTRLNRFVSIPRLC